MATVAELLQPVEADLDALLADLRSLIGAFAANQRWFHNADGAGYRLLADQLIAVDRVNPQSAARLAVPLGRWRRFDAARSALMRGELIEPRGNMDHAPT